MSLHLKNIGVVSVLTMVSRVLGLFRDMLVTAVFGRSLLTDAFYTAFTLPNLFRRLLGEGSLTAAFVPTLQEELRARERAGAFRLVSQVGTWLLLISGAIVLLVMLALGLFLVLSDGSKWADAARLALILFPYMLFVCFSAVFSAALQTLQRFVEPALSPIWLNLAMIGFLGAAVWLHTGAEGAMLWLCVGVLVGGFFQLAVPALTLARLGWRPKLILTVDEPMRQIGRLMGPTIFGSAIYLINISISRLLGFNLGNAAVTDINIASRLMELPIGIFAVAISTVVFPLIARHAAAGDADKLATSYRKGMRLVLALNIPAAVGLVLLAEPIIRLLFERGDFTASDTSAVAPVLVAFACGLPFFSFVSLALRAFYVRKDTRTPVRAAVFSLFVNVVVSFLLMGSLGAVGLAIAINAAVLAQAAYLQLKLARGHAELSARFLAGDIARIVLAAALMGGVVFAGWNLWGRFPPGTLMDIVGLALVIGVAVGVYAGLLWLLKIEGRDEVAAMLSRFRR